MKKGRFGIALAFYAVAAFVLAFLGQTYLCFILLGFVIAAEKDEWLTRQAIQACMLVLIEPVVRGAMYIFNIFDSVPYLGRILSGLSDIVIWLLSVLVFVLALIAVLKVSKERDAGLPVASSVADWAYGVVKQKTYVAPPPAAAPNAPAQYTPAVQPPQAPVAPQTPEAETKPENIQ